MIPYGRQDVSEDDIEAVVSVLRSDFLTQGPEIPRFENTLAEYCGVGHAVAVNSATSALHLAYRALGLGPGGVVWTSPITFAATANATRYCGASVDFVDIGPATYNLSVGRLEEKLTVAERAGGLPDIVVPVHLAGQSCDMQAINRLADRYRFKVVEDASHAIGGRYRGSPVGDCRYSDIAVFSFHPVKIITSGEGGMALTNDPALAERMALLRTHGITKEDALMQGEIPGPWYYEQIELGYNYRMTDIQAALGRSQMSRLDGFVERRHEIANQYAERLDGLPLVRPWQDPDTHSSFHLYIVRVEQERTGTSHSTVFECLRAAGIGVQLHYIPVYRHPYYMKFGFDRRDYPESERYYAEAISLPIYPTLTPADQETVANVIERCLRSDA